MGSMSVQGGLQCTMLRIQGASHFSRLNHVRIWGNTIQLQLQLFDQNVNIILET